MGFFKADFFKAGFPRADFLRAGSLKGVKNCFARCGRPFYKKHRVSFKTFFSVSIIIFTLAIFLSGCGGSAPKNLPPISLSGANYPANGMLVYSAKTAEGKPKGEETISFNTKEGVMCIKSSVMLAEVCVDKNTFSPLSARATYKVANMPSYVKITFSDEKIKETVQRNGKEKKFVFKRPAALFVDDALDFVMQGFDFSKKEGYLTDFFPYTSVMYPCRVENIGKTTIKYNGKDTEVYELLLDFGKKQRFLYFLTSSPHLLIRREENGLTYTLVSYKFSQ